MTMMTTMTMITTMLILLWSRKVGAGAADGTSIARIAVLGIDIPKDTFVIATKSFWLYQMPSGNSSNSESAALETPASQVYRIPSYLPFGENENYNSQGAPLRHHPPDVATLLLLPGS